MVDWGREGRWRCTEKRKEKGNAKVCTKICRNVRCALFRNATKMETKTKRNRNGSGKGRGKSGTRCGKQIRQGIEKENVYALEMHCFFAFFLIFFTILQIQFFSLSTSLSHAFPFGDALITSFLPHFNTSKCKIISLFEEKAWKLWQGSRGVTFFIRPRILFNPKEFHVKRPFPGYILSPSF